MKFKGKDIILKGVEASRIKTLNDACRPCVFYKGNNCPRGVSLLMCTEKKYDKNYHFVYSLSKILKEL